MVAQRAKVPGRTDSLYPGLRYYRFHENQQFQKMQRLVPGVVVVLQGSKTATIAGRNLHYDPNSCLVLGREALCKATVVCADAHSPYLAIHLDLPSALLSKTLGTLAEVVSEIPRATVNDAQFVAPVDLRVLEALVRLLPATEDALERHTIAPLILEEIVVRLLRSDAAYALRNAMFSGFTIKRIHDSMERIRTQLTQALTVNELAQEAAMSPSHYAHSFRMVAGVSPMRYLRDMRLDAARALLLDGQLRVGDVGLRVGFENPAHFSREFKRRYEFSPAEYVCRLQALWPAQNAASDKHFAVVDIAKDVGAA